MNHQAMTTPRSLNSAGKVVLRLLAPLLIVLAACVPAMAASNGPTIPSGDAAGWGYADFDGDHKPDLAELHRASVELRLSTGNQLYLATSLSQAPGREIVVVDLDGDHDLDIVVRNRFLAVQADIWLNDGRGSFTESSSHNDPFPTERDSWKRSSSLVPGISITIKPLNLFAGLTSGGRLAPPLPGTGIYAPDALGHFQIHSNTTQLRGPPSPTFS
jgi:hypothetical protein